MAEQSEMLAAAPADAANHSASVSSSSPPPSSAPPPARAMCRVETLTPARFEDVRAINNEFIGTSGKACCGICPFRWCPIPSDAFAKSYAGDLADNVPLTGVAVSADGEALGAVRLSLFGIKRPWDAEFMHTMKPEEMYIDWIAVKKTARGHGAGSALLRWTEALARERGAKTLSLSVVKGNDGAKRLYERKGYVVRPHGDCCDEFCACCGSCMMIGLPSGCSGGCGAPYDMVLDLSSPPSSEANTQT